MAESTSVASICYTHSECYKYTQLFVDDTTAASESEAVVADIYLS